MCQKFQRAGAILVLLGVVARPAEAAIVTQLDITGGSLSLDFGSQGSVAGSFTQSGTLLMGQYQLPGTILPAFNVESHTFTLFTSNFDGAPVPSGQTSGTTINVDLSSLFTTISGPIFNGALDIGGQATGTFDPNTGQFSISWIHLYPGTAPFLNIASLTLDGTTPGAPVPLPAAGALFATGLAGMAFGRRLVAARREHRQPAASCRMR